MLSARIRRTSRTAFLLPLILFFACSTFVYEPAPVVPTTLPLPYSATFRLAELEAYNVEPGATMVADPRIENKVRGVRQPLSKAKKEWERSIADYVAARKTFTYLSADSQPPGLMCTDGSERSYRWYTSVLCPGFAKRRIALRREHE
jgi:hypothetical protein